METLLQDVRYGLRVMRKSPVFTLVAVLTLALGIGANTAIFTLINSVLLEMLPVKSPGQLVVVGDPQRVHSRSLGDPRVDLFSYPLYRELSADNKVFSGMLASAEVHRVRVAGEGDREISSETTGVLVSGNYFSVLGLNPVIGRLLSADDDAKKAANPVAVVSYDFWINKLGGENSVVGSTLHLNNYPYTVIGVAPPGFFGDSIGDKQDFWVPVTMQEQLISGRKWLDDFDASWLHIIARLNPGVTVAQASSNLNLVLQQLVDGPVGARLHKDDRENLKKAKIQVHPGGGGFSELRGDFYGPLMLLMAIVGLVLLIACVNVANLLLARASAREREIAVRLAIGANPWRVTRQFLTESILLALTGGAIGLLLAHWATAALLKLSRNTELSATPDTRVLLFTAGVSLLTGVLFGLVPAFRSRKIGVTMALKAGTQMGGTAAGSRWSWGKSLVAAQVTLSLLVLFAAGLLVRSLQKMRNLDLGYSHEHLLVINTDPLAAGYKLGQIAQYANEAVARFSTLPGVRVATYSKNGLFSGSESGESLQVQGFAKKTDSDLDAASDDVGPNYFTAISIPVLLGRDIGPQDTETSPKVAVINQTMAKFYFGDLNPIGRTFAIDDPNLKAQPITIVGVTGDARDHELRGKIPRRFYVPLTQATHTISVVNFEIRTAGNPESVIAEARKQLKALDSNVPVYSARSVQQLLDRTMSNEILVARLSSFFAGLALLLACIGLYGIMSYSVSGRTREIGVRMALGAKRGSVLWMVLGEALRVLAIGIIIGIPAALLSSRLLSSMLFGLTAADPISMAFVIVILAGVAVFASWIPARRATRVDPMVALRYE
jgi:predicted permease